MFTPQKTPEIVPSYDVVQNLARFIMNLPRLGASKSGPKVTKIKKAAEGKTQRVINGFMNYAI